MTLENSAAVNVAIPLGERVGRSTMPVITVAWRVMKRRHILKLAGGMAA
jgi:hypothetical protein